MKKTIKEIIEYKKKFLSYYEHTNNPEIHEMVEYIKKVDRFDMMNCELEKDYANLQANVCFDPKQQMRFLYEKGRRLYFPDQYDEDSILNLFRSLKREQDLKSPHRYLDNTDIAWMQKQQENGRKILLLEIGAMEGMFSLELIDRMDEVVIFEGDAKWAGALKNTFMPWNEKVKIVNRYVSDYSDKLHICIDDYYKNELQNTCVIVKMDIEGDERYALEGMRKILGRASQFMLFVCVYHKKDDECVVRNMFPGCRIRNTHGYFCFYDSEDYDEPYVRRCLLKINN